eukprot:2139141-Amphidinium_carterae.1
MSFPCDHTQRLDLDCMGPGQSQNKVLLYIGWTTLLAVTSLSRPMHWTRPVNNFHCKHCHVAGAFAQHARRSMKGTSYQIRDTHPKTK